VRYRLRFLLQEFDLPLGATIIGRSLDCNLTIEDPLVSREHARIVIDHDGARIEDMKSRNGVRVNGSAIRETMILHDGDRVRVGTQDMIFCRVGAAGRAHSKTTGVLRLCADCRLPYPRELVSCPHCGATEQTDEVTLTDHTEEHRAIWNVQLLLETLERALVLGRLADAKRIVRGATAQIDEMMRSGHALDSRTFGAVAAKVAGVTLTTGDPAWALWVIDVYRRTGLVPPLDAGDRLADAAVMCPKVVCGPLLDLLDHLRVSGTAGSIQSEAERETMNRLERVLSSIEDARASHDAVRSSTETTEEWPGLP
jgi:hypothetical protein